MSQLKLLDEIVVAYKPNIRRIRFCVGDLSRLDAEDEIDLLVVSAFPGAYEPIPGSLIGALQDAGVSVANLARNIAIDLRNSFSCWISHPLFDRPPNISFKRILCYEPLTMGAPDQYVGDIFRSIAPLLGDVPPVKTVALPIVASGYQKASQTVMLRLIIEAAVHWMSIGLPLHCITIVYYPCTQFEEREISHEMKHGRWNEERLRDGWRYSSSRREPSDLQELRKVFQEATSDLTRSMTRSDNFRHDIFLSYAHRDQKETHYLLGCLAEKSPDLKVFFDRKELVPGSAWQQEIYEALDDCRKVVALYSPSYLSSKVCLEEFNIALCRNRDSGDKVVLPLYLYTCELPTYMKLVQFRDCREFDLRKIHSVCDELIKEVRPGNVV